MGVHFTHWSPLIFWDNYEKVGHVSITIIRDKQDTLGQFSALLNMNNFGTNFIDAENQFSIKDAPALNGNSYEKLFFSNETGAVAYIHRSTWEEQKTLRIEQFMGFCKRLNPVVN